MHWLVTTVSQTRTTKSHKDLIRCMTQRVKIDELLDLSWEA